MEQQEVDNFLNWLKQINPESEKDNQNFEESMEQFVREHALLPPPHLKESILAKIRELCSNTAKRQILDPCNLPDIDDSSNYLDWVEAVKDIPFPDDFNGFHIHPLIHNEERQLSIAWMTGSAEEDGHYDLYESFLILDGSCECKIIEQDGKERVVNLFAGDYLAIPLGVHHTVTVKSSSPIKAILQRIMIAA